jgi:hypothetical protein
VLKIWCQSQKKGFKKKWGQSQIIQQKLLLQFPKAINMSIVECRRRHRLASEDDFDFKKLLYTTAATVAIVSGAAEIVGLITCAGIVVRRAVANSNHQHADTPQHQAPAEFPYGGSLPAPTDLPYGGNLEAAMKAQDRDAIRQLMVLRDSRKPSRSRKDVLLQQQEDVLLQYFDGVNALLTRPDIKDELAVAFKNNENILYSIEILQKSIWASLNIQVQIGSLLLKCIKDSKTVTEKIKIALEKSAAVKKDVLMYAILGSQEQVDQEKERSVQLKYSAEIDFYHGLQIVMEQGPAATAKFTRDTMTKLQSLKINFGVNEIDRLKRKLQLSDMEYINLFKGECLLLMQGGEYGQGDPDLNGTDFVTTCTPPHYQMNTIKYHNK